MTSYYQANNDCRQKLIRADHGNRLRKDAPRFQTLAELKKALQEAINLEHFTIPPYLCALYSIKDGCNEMAARIIRSVVLEEMLHMIMAANILNAIGGKPRISARESIPKYPSPLPHSAIKFEVGLRRFSKDAINTFLRIERPADDHVPTKPDQFRSIGEFYEAIREALIRLNSVAIKKGVKKGIFTGKPQKQVTSQHYYGSGGKLIEVDSLENADLTIDEIVGQGEGIDGTIHDADDQMFDDDVEFAHYFRFNEIFNERQYDPKNDKTVDTPSGLPLPVDWDAVYNVIPDPKIKMFQSDVRLHSAMITFNKTYMQLLQNIEQACNGQPDILKDGVPLMYELKYQAIQLMNTPCGTGNYTAGPSFEYLAL